MTRAAAGPTESTDATRRGLRGLLAYQSWLRWGCAAVLVVCFGLLVRSLPVDDGIRAMKQWVGSMGDRGPLAYGLIYIVGSLLMVPGVPMTVAAGAVFPFWVAFVTVNVGATITGTVAFVLARHVARRRMERFFEHRPKFRAIDAALEEGSWKILVLLRLSPAVPFTPVNYALGLTRARFWPYVFATWLGTMPGTLLYCYLGNVAAAGLAGGLRWQRWAYLGLGLAATAVATIYLAKLSRQKLQEQTNVDLQPDQPEAPAAWKWTTFLLAGLTLAAVAAAVLVQFVPLKSLLGPPAVNASEAYEKKPGGPTFDHSAFTTLLKAHVNERGGVDYEGFKADRAKLTAYRDAIAKADFDSLGRNEKLAMLLDAYNASTIELILDHGTPASIMDIPEAERWKAKRWVVGGKTYSLDQIEHEQIRAKFEEPRIHFALVCAAESCPPLRAEAYTGAKVSDQLGDQATYCMSHPRWLQYDGGGTIKLTALLNFYGGDFKPLGGVLPFVATYVPALKQKLDAGEKPTVEFLNYSWALNSQKNVPAKE